ncbi:MAG: cytochrome c maturation protein CcmE [Gammaproteobacteria bacterium]|jgi:cytochrome c-type biogenesis protein CcmE|nr:cytochrome c maturation protein CcmE [Gammaproteobacteria bacterium]MBT4077988.1 cytochrome c maturation protein CcmE [Gammaproteobacteria bacterium]MBT4194394.1 cytochrome c maturation protein CcmE [Gammaproteobacteria bacterium]MBT4450746.1 cytochrome c maturation protein CcmE [Gammaproteobacteria bacterium]MBT4861576.1 cytochrome c maturation protein CcmE [Gammaproteobacteria bacterium]
MTPARKKRLSLIVLMVVGVSVGVGFALNALNENIMFFFSPADIQAGKAPENKDFRVGGVVVEGTVARPGEGLTVEFDLTDNDSIVKVKYTGILPDLFREGQGIIANGRLNSSGEFIAAEVLAKHDENYMPPEVMDAMKESGQKMPSMSQGI